MSGFTKNRVVNIFIFIYEGIFLLKSKIAGMCNLNFNSSAKLSS